MTATKYQVYLNCMADDCFPYQIAINSAPKLEISFGDFCT